MLKDRAAVEAVQADFLDEDDEDPSATFNRLTDEIKTCLATVRGAALMTFLLSDYYSQPYTIDWFNDKAEFESGARYKFIDVDEGERANWSNKTPKALAVKLKELGVLVSENEQVLRKSEPDVPLDPTAQDFWEYHYNL